MMACNRRAKTCAVTVRAPRDSSVSPSDRRSRPNSDSTASLLGNAGAGHCTRQGCTRPYPGRRYAHQLLGREDYGEELEEMTSISLVEQLLLAGPTCRGPAHCKHSPWTIKGRVHSIEKGKVQQSAAHTGSYCSPFGLTQLIQHQSGCRVLRSNGPNHSKSLRHSCVHPRTDRAFLSLLQTHP
jgi:hypothetical protein